MLWCSSNIPGKLLHLGCSFGTLQKMFMNRHLHRNHKGKLISAAKCHLDTYVDCRRPGKRLWCFNILHAIERDGDLDLRYHLRHGILNPPSVFTGGRPRLALQRQPCLVYLLPLLKDVLALRDHGLQTSPTILKMLMGCLKLANSRRQFGIRLPEAVDRAAKLLCELYLQGLPATSVHPPWRLATSDQIPEHL